MNPPQRPPTHQEMSRREQQLKLRQKLLAMIVRNETARKPQPR